jgi:pimeloyl-ACP methyl ester carboxylesterase
MVRAMSEVLTKTRNSGLRNWIHKQHRENFSVFANRSVAIEGYWASSGQGVASYARSIIQPVFMIIGELDDITSLEDQTRTKSLFPQAELVKISDVGHLIHYEKPEKAASLVRDFLKRLPSKQ